MEIGDIPRYPAAISTQLFTRRDRIAALIFRRDWSNIICPSLSFSLSPSFPFSFSLPPSWPGILVLEKLEEFLDTATTTVFSTGVPASSVHGIMKSRTWQSVIIGFPSKEPRTSKWEYRPSRSHYTNRF